MTAWSSWTNCRCGYSDQKNRTRSIKNHKVGEGLPCFNIKETGTCTIVPCDCSVVNPGYYGDRCTNRDCVLSSWSSWEGCTGCPHGCGQTPTMCSTLHPKKHRKRHVTITKVGLGKGCSGKTSETNSCGYRCVYRCSGGAFFSKRVCKYNRE